jgi:phosphoenolpyruvate carboxykinase (ATP)
MGEPTTSSVLEDLPGRRVYWNLPAAALYEESARRHEGLIAAEGPLVCRTGEHTGRSPHDKFIVRDDTTSGQVAWGDVNQPMTVEHFASLERDLVASLKGRDLFVQDCYAAADPRYRRPVRIITEWAWHSLFARNLLTPRSRATHEARQQPDEDRRRMTIIASPSFEANPGRHGTRSSVVIALNLSQRLVLIGGTGYAGEIKKSVFTLLNYFLPLEDVLSMHCSANVGAAEDTALFFGLSGTGKTTLSSDPARRLIGDDEHAWSDEGVFNIEGGCYAKTIRLSARAEPQIHATTRRFGTVLENVVIDAATRELDLDDARITENTRAAYPLSFMDGTVPSRRGGHPQNIVMLTADAFGVLPPIARLTRAGAMYHFLSGYTAKVAGTERGVTEPKATFSACFGAPFLPLAPVRYADLFGKKLDVHRTRVWLVNTGWTGGPYGTGKRMAIDHTRAMIHAALDGRLDSVGYDRDSIFNLEVPVSCPGVPADLLTPRRVWPDETAYEEQAMKLARMFQENFRAFEETVQPDVRAAGPGASS